MNNFSRSSRIKFENTLPGIGPHLRAPRMKYSTKVFIQPQVEGESPFWCQTHDFNEQGLFFVCSYQLPCHTRVELKFKTLWGTLKLKGMVVYSILGLGFGCEFIEVTPRQQQILYCLAALKRGALISKTTIVSRPSRPKQNS